MSSILEDHKWAAAQALLAAADEIEAAPDIDVVAFLRGLASKLHPAGEA